jgi:hypothetical protein
MTAFESRLALSCKQTSDAAGEILDWLGRDGALVGTERVALLHEFYRAESSAQKLAIAVSRPPTLALVGPARVGKSHLAASLIERGGQPLTVHFDGIREEIPYLKHIAPDSVRYGTAAITRLSQRSRALQHQCPVDLRLLSTVDLIRIFATIWLTVDESRTAELPSVENVKALEKRLSQRVAPEPIPGLTEEDVWDLRDHLTARHSDDRLIKALASIGYWELLAELGPAVPASVRSELLAPLWGGVAVLTSAFVTMTETLASLGYGRTASCALDGVVGLDARTGRFQRRTDSILSAGTMGALVPDPEQTVVVQSETAQWVSVPRVILTAITSQVRLPIKGTMSDLLERGDIVEMPAIDAREPVDSLRRAIHADATIVGRLFMRAKALLLMERAIDDFDVTALAVCAPLGSRRMGDIAPLVARWVERNQGADAAQRESRDCSLFVVFTKLDREFGDGNRKGRDKATNWDEAIVASLVDGLGQAADWSKEWTPLRAFDQIHVVRVSTVKSRSLLDYGHDNRETAYKQQQLERIAEARAQFLASAAVRRHVAEPETVWREAFELNDGGVTFLGESIAHVFDSRVKQRQITAELLALRRTMRDRLTRYVASDHPALQLDQRHNAALMVSRRLRRTAEAHRFGHLLRALQVSEIETSDVLTALEAKSAQSEVAQFTPVNGKAKKKPRPGLDADRYARRVVTHWIEALRALPNISHTDERYRLPRSALLHLVDEVVIGARRLDVEGRVAERIRQLLSETSVGPERIARAALAASSQLNDFIITLGYDNTFSNDHPRRRGKSQAPIFEKKPPLALDQIVDETAPFDQQFYQDWIEAFMALVAANGQALKDQAGKQKDAPKLAELIKLLDAPL